MEALEATTIRNALALARRHGFDEVELRAGEAHFAATLLTRRGPARAEAPAAPAPSATEIPSPAVGYAHLAALNPGDPVKGGDRLATIETLGIANDLLAPRAGTLREFRVEDEAPVEYGQIVAILEAE